MSLTFEEDGHVYRWHGVVVPSVTTCLSPLTDFSKIPVGTLETARQKGVAVHKMVELHSKGDLDEDSLPTWMTPALEQWKKFVADTGFEMIVSEHRVYHEQYAYAGTLDLLGIINGKLSFVDIKRSFLAGMVIGFQLAAYSAAYFSQEKNALLRKADRYALKLNETGPYRLEQFDDYNDFNHFVTCLAFYKLQKRIST